MAVGISSVKVVPPLHITKQGRDKQNMNVSNSRKKEYSFAQCCIENINLGIYH